MINVKLNRIKNNRMTGDEALLFMTKAAQTCYKDTIPEPTEPMNIKDSIFKVSHHTILQHLDFSFEIDGISVGDITFGLHLVNSYYNSSQRSGRFCAAMFANPDIDRIMAYICHYYHLTGYQKETIKQYLAVSLQTYREFLPAATEKVREMIKKERPNASNKYIAQNAEKIAQEQLRAFVPVIFPTGIFHTINLSALVALYRSAWNPVMKDLTQQMASLVIAAIPGTAYMFEREFEENFSIKVGASNEILREVQHATLLTIPDIANAVVPCSEDMHPIDLLPFKPEYMNNNVINIISKLLISIATMGQNQRHRTNRRGTPMLTGGFYLPPILAMLNLDHRASIIMDRFWEVQTKDIPKQLMATLAPYGAIVEYVQSASLNAFLHEGHKRLCHCAQQEIYDVSNDLRRQLIETTQNPELMTKLLASVSPLCISGKGCGEGTRCCGRDLKEAVSNPFPKRTI